MTSKDNLWGLSGEFHVERCKVCGHRFMNPRPVLESLAAFIHPSTPASIGSGSGNTFKSGNQITDRATVPDRPLYLRILPLRHVPGLKYFYNWLMDDRSQPVPIAPVSTSHAADSAPIEGSRPEKPRALELGCATGQYLVRMQDAGWLATGIEPGERPASIAKEAGLDVHCGTLDAIELQSEQFELTAAWMVIEHVLMRRRRCDVCTRY
ncbi:MAG: methyltransferase domain-containing protein [Planctomycetaceae bacterium]